MTANSRSRKKSGSTHGRVYADDRDRLIAELKARIEAMENGLALKRGSTGSSEATYPAEEARRDNERFLNLVFDSITDGISILDRDLNIIRVNSTIESWHSDMSPLTGKKCYYAYHGRSEPCECCPNIKAMREKSAQTGIVPRDLGGKTVGWQEVHSFPLMDTNGDITGVISYARDITKRKEAEEALRQNEEKYRELVENANSIILRWDVSGRIRFFNEYAQRFFGYSAGEIIGKDVNVLVPNTETTGRDISTLIEDIHRYPERFVKNVNENVLKSGDRAWISWANKAIYDKQGNLVEILAIGNDITERKRAEEAVTADLKDTQLLRDLGARLISEGDVKVLYQEILDAAAAIMRSDFASIQMFHPERGNGGELRLLAFRGFSPEAAMFWEWVRTDSESACGMTLHAGQRVIVTDVEKCGSMAGTEDLAMYRRTGIRAVQTTPLFSRTGRLVGMISTQWRKPHQPSERELRFFDLLARQAADLIERKRAEETITEARDYYLKLFEDFPTPIWRSDTAGKCNYLNRSWYKFTGRAAEQEMGDGWMEGIHPDDVKLVKEVSEAAFDARKPFALEYRLRHKDGSYRSIIDYGKPLFGLNGEFGGYIGSCYDITERKRAEEAVLEAKQQAELYLDLMGHDINNMHQIALGYLELAEGMTPEDDCRREFLEKPIEVLQRSTRLISNVRKMQKLIDGSLHSQVIDLREVLSTVKREFGSVPQKPVTLKLDGMGPCCVQANELIYDIFSNLVTNAIKHTGYRADISVVLESADENGSRYYRVSVADNGPGIPDNFKGVIFNRLLKGTNKAKGMGLGLYLVKSLAESYGGKVWVEDRVKGDHTKGAKFVVLLPVAEK